MTCRLALPLLTLALTLAACGPDGGTVIGDTTPPSVALTASPTNVTAAGNISLTATASDNVGVTQVDFYRGSTLVGSDAEAPYTATDRVTSADNGTRSYTAVATDAAGNSATSPEVTVNVGISPICSQSVGGQSLPGTVQAASVIQTSVRPPNWSAPHVPGQVLVTDAGGGISAQALNALSTVRTQSVTQDLRLAFTPAGETDRAFAGRLTAAGLRVQPNFIYQPLALPNDPGYPGNGGVKVGSDNTTRVQDYLPRIHADGAWNFLAACGKTPVGALTAVLDSGVDSGHPDLQGRLLPGATFAASGTTTTDETGHGTGVAGLLGAATNNQIGLAGVTWSGRNVLPVKVFNTGDISTAALAQGLDYAVKQGAKVINMSLGAPRSADPAKDPSDPALDEALNRAAQSAVLVAAAGNTPNEGVYYPASNPNVIAVGAVGTKDNELASYSARPNANFPRPLNIVAPGGGTTGATALLALNAGGGYQLTAGTSEATPLVSGVAALMRAANPGLSAAETRKRLLESVRRLQSPNFPEEGLPLLDAEAAVRAATR
ncbi:S8 family serine peptidase [Deinococcus apachensis]|uniref:S8 family serine peptidase n=1 Tax=Deinococcus apachensis TaxID=309886 RepID=UPI0003A33C9F|nr:S8 family serine peptidase [Deinococcus apachensis]